MSFHKAGEKACEEVSLLILPPVNKAGAMSKKKQTTLAERTWGEEKSIGSLTGGSSLVRLFSLG